MQKEVSAICNPVRIQRKRIKGWKMPENTIYVGRPTCWGNPFKTAGEYREAWKGFNGHSDLVRLFRSKGWMGSITEHPRYYLRGKDLACWCALDCECHADVLLELANV